VRLWEGLWQVADKGSEIRSLLKGLILPSAAGAKIREDKRTAARRHAVRAAGMFRCLAQVQQDDFERAPGLRLQMLADYAEATAASPPVLLGTGGGQPEPVFEFILGREFATPNTPDAGRVAQGI
jgi:hypothetical protein